jgi:hypothetical protein
MREGQDQEEMPGHGGGRACVHEQLGHDNFHQVAADPPGDSKRVGLAAQRSIPDK